MFVTYFARKFHNHILCFSKINFLKIDVLSRNEAKERYRVRKKQFKLGKKKSFIKKLSSIQGLKQGL